MIRLQSCRLQPTVRCHQRRTITAAYEKVCTRTELQENDGRLRARVNGKNVFVQEDAGKLHCLSNVCTHLKLPLVGRTALAQGKFKLDTGEVIGEWAPTFPSIPFVGKGDATPLPVYSVRETEGGDIEVEVPDE